MGRRPARAGEHRFKSAFPVQTWVAAARARWVSDAFRDARRALDAACAADHANLPPVPRQRAGYYHDYFCPEHAVSLMPSAPAYPGHACPVDGRTFTGDRYDAASGWLVNNRLSSACLRLAFRQMLDPDAMTASQDRAVVASILSGYAAIYPRLAAHPGGLPAHPGVVTFSGLDKSVWLTRVAWAFGLVAHELGPERQRISSRLLRPASAHLWAVRAPAEWPEIDNIAVWNDAALIAVAAVLGDEANLQRAIEQPIGLRHQLRRGVRADGLWWEGSLGYHYYTLAAAVWAFRTLEALGRDDPDRAVLQSMFLAPLAAVLPDGSLPAINDGWHDIGITGHVGHDMPSASGFYETAYGWFGDAAFADVLLRGDATPRRTSIEAIMDGAERLPDRPASRAPSGPAIGDLAPSGLAILRAGPTSLGGSRRLAARAAAGPVAILKAGPHGGDHGHPDQLGLQLFGAGVRLLDDLGTAGYGIGLNESWYRTTACHNTLVIDGWSQPLADGTVSTRLEGEHALVARGVVSWDHPATGLGASAAYVGVTAWRQVALTPEYLLDVLEVAGDRRMVIDWIVLPRGTRVSRPRGRAISTARLGFGAGYAHVDGLRQLEGTPSVLRWVGGGRVALDVYLAPPSPDGSETLMVGEVPGNPASERRGFVIRRRHAMSTRFLAVLVPARSGDCPVHRVTWSRVGGDEGEAIVHVTTARGHDRWRMEGDTLHLAP